MRIAAYITANARCQLFEGIYATGKVFGMDAPSYTDTDSIHVSILQTDKEIAEKIIDVSASDM